MQIRKKLKLMMLPLSNSIKFAPRCLYCFGLIFALAMLSFASSGSDVGDSAVPGGRINYRYFYPLPSGGNMKGWGVNIHFTHPQPHELDKIAAAGFRWVRMDFSWSDIERVKGQYDFSDYDRLMSALKRDHLRPIFILDYGNDLYQKGSPTSPEAIQGFVQFVQAAILHFRDQGIVWEMWNEPNIGFWKPHPDVQQYIRLATAVGKTIRKVAPEEWFIGPGV